MRSCVSPELYYSDGSSTMRVLASPPRSPSGEEDSLVGGDEASSERSAISPKNCTNQRRESVASRSVPDDNWLLCFQGDQRGRKPRYCRFIKSRPPAVSRTSRCHGGRRPF